MIAQSYSYSHLHSISVVEVPYINCPTDIQLTLPSDRASFPLGFKFPQPQTNMKIIKVSHARNFAFPVGTTIIKFDAEDSEGTKRSCSVIVDILGKFCAHFFLQKIASTNSAIVLIIYQFALKFIFFIHIHHYNDNITFYYTNSNYYTTLQGRYHGERKD